MFISLFILQMYNSRSHSPPDTGKHLAGYVVHTKRKAEACNSTKAPRKVPRQDSSDSNIPKPQTVSSDSSSDSDDDASALGPGTATAISSHPDNNDSDRDSNHREGPNDAEDKDLPERRYAGDDDIGSENVIKFRSTTTIATRGRGADSNLKLPLDRQVPVASTVSKMHKPFISIDFEAIRQGFLEGGVKSTDGKSTSSTSLKIQDLIKETHLVVTFRSICL